jgi:hypothetical protein
MGKKQGLQKLENDVREEESIQFFAYIDAKKIFRGVS